MTAGAAAGQLAFVFELPWRNENVAGLGAVNGYDPTSWRPYALDYREAGTNNPIFPSIHLTHAGIGAAQFSFVQGEVNRGVGVSTYFPRRTP